MKKLTYLDTNKTINKKPTTVVEPALEVPVETSAVLAAIATLGHQINEVKQQNVEIRQQNVEIREQNLRLEAKVDKIAKNVLIIKEKVIGEFAGIEPKTMAELTADFEEVTEEEAFQEIVSHVKPFRAPRGKKAPKNNLRTSSMLKQWAEQPVSRAQEAAYGNWVGGVMAKVFGIKLNGWYHPKLEGVMTTLTNFYLYEREANGRMY
jgi:hypothetical protein